MCHCKGMAREDLHFRLRIPEDLKKRLRRASVLNARSITAEIIARLDASFVVNDIPPIDPNNAELVDLVADLENLKRKVIQALLPQK